MEKSETEPKGECMSFSVKGHLKRVKLLGSYSPCQDAHHLYIDFNVFCFGTLRCTWDPNVKQWYKLYHQKGFCGVVVITSALHAEGREFEPRQNLCCAFLLHIGLLMRSYNYESFVLVEWGDGVIHMWFKGDVSDSIMYYIIPTLACFVPLSSLWDSRVRFTFFKLWEGNLTAVLFTFDYNSQSRLKFTISKPLYEKGFCGVVVITSALHAEGREFEPRQNLHFSIGIWGSAF